MCPRILTVGLCLLLLAGCKRGAKDTGPGRDDRSGEQSVPARAERKAEKKDEPNWLKDERAQSKTDQLPVDGPTSSGKQPWNVGAPAGGFQPTTGAATAPNAPPGKPTAGGTGVLQPEPAAQGANPAPAGNAPPTGLVNRTVTEADMRDIHTFIDNRSGATGRMPSQADTFTALAAAQSPAAGLVKAGAIILTDAKQRESVWAFEANAYLKGGLLVGPSGVERVTAEELKKRLGK